MKKHRKISERELKLTAALYASIPRVLKHVQTTGKLPLRIDAPGAHIGMGLLIDERGTDIKLTAQEHLVYDAIIRERRLPGGSVILIDEKEKDGKVHPGGDPINEIRPDSSV